MIKDKGFALAVSFLIIFFIISVICYAAPVGPSRIQYLENKTRGLSGPLSRDSDERGTITVVQLNVTQQSLYWKAYAGNVSGRITLDDDLNYTIYDWILTSTGGEVYATRKISLVDWITIRCANSTMTETEMDVINHTIEKSDTLNRTFGRNNHPLFFVGNARFGANSCNKTIHTYVSDSTQQSSFSEVLLYDASGYVVYTSIMNNSIKGYDNGYYDFQMLVGEKGQEGVQAPIVYYFYVELT